MLALLLVPANRRSAGFSIVLPYGALLLAGSAPQSLWFGIPSEPVFILQQIARSMALALAAVFLLGHVVAWKNRFVTLAWTIIVMGASGVVILVPQLQFGGFETGPAQVFVGTALAIFTTALALAFTSLFCRGKEGLCRVFACFVLGSIASGVATATPFLLIMMIIEGGRVPGSAFFEATVTIIALAFSLLLPFIVLCLCVDFYRKRLNGLLHLGREKPPVVIATAPTVATSVSSS